MKYTENTGGDGRSGMKGSIIRNIWNSQFEEIMGDIEYIQSGFTWNGNLSEYSNTILKITHDHDLSHSNILLPSGTTLWFDGGRLLNIGNLSGNTSRILNPKNLQCFNSAVTFAGTWINTIITPQSFGAICNSNPNIFQNSSSVAIQKVFDSPFEPYFPNGYYYLTTSIIITRQINVDFGIPVHEMIDNMNSFVFNNKGVRFYTNLDINFWEIRHHGVYLKGGVMDIRNVAPFTKAVYYYHGNYKCNFGECSGYVIGSLTGVRTSGATGKAVHWDCSNVTVDWGYIATLKWDIKTIYVPYGIVIDDPTTSGKIGLWCTALEIYGVFDGCKKALVIKTGSTTKIKCYTQTRPVLTLSEREYYQVEIGAPITIDIFNWDLSPSSENGYYYPNNGTILTSNGVVLEGMSLYSYSLGQIDTSKSSIYPSSFQPITHKNELTILKQKWDKNNFISELHNAWLGIDKTMVVTVNAYDGSTIDFDNSSSYQDGATLNLSGATTGITLTDTTNLFKSSGYPFRYYVNGNANLDTDFVEIMITGGTIYANTLYISLIQESGVINKIQAFGIKPDLSVSISSETDGVYSSYSRPYYKFSFTSGYNKFVIRLIGITKNPDYYSPYNDNVTIQNGLMNLVINSGLSYTSGSTFIMTHDRNNYMSGIVWGYTGETGSFSGYTNTTNGSGTYNTWKINTNSTTAIYLEDVSAFYTSHVQNYVGKYDVPKLSYKGHITQTGTTAPYLNELLNLTNQTVYCTYSSIGTYYLYCNGSLTAGKTDPLNRTIDIGSGNTLTITRNSVNTFLLVTKNSGGTPTDGLLTNITIEFDIYW